MPARALRIVGRVIAVILCCLSLALCAAAAALWARGYFTVDVAELWAGVSTYGNVTNRIYRVSSGRGVVAFTFTYQFYVLPTLPRGATRWPPVRSRRYVHRTLRPDQFYLARRAIWQRIGFYVNSNDFTRRGDNGQVLAHSVDRGLRLPYWLIVLATGVLPILYLRRLGRLVRRYRYRHGLCPGCGYDVRATPDRCPECGEAIAATKVPVPVATGAVT